MLDIGRGVNYIYEKNNLHMKIDFLIVALATLIPLIVGFIWYNPKVFGAAWMKTTGMTEEKAKQANMAVIFGLTILFSFMIAMVLNGLVIHQYGLMSLIADDPKAFKDPTAESTIWFNASMDKYGAGFRTFKHGAFHGFIISLMLVLPVIGTNALFERRGFKYVMINWGYWAVCLMLMGGTICQWATII